MEHELIAQWKNCLISEWSYIDLKAMSADKFVPSKYLPRSLLCKISVKLVSLWLYKTWIKLVYSGTNFIQSGTVGGILFFSGRIC